MAEVVDPNTHLEPVRGEAGLPDSRGLDRSIADKPIERGFGLPPKALHELADAVQPRKVEVHNGVVLVSHAGELGDLSQP